MAKDGHYTLRYIGQGTPPSGDLLRLHHLPGVTVVEQTGKVVRVIGPRNLICTALYDHDAWTIRGEPGTVPEHPS